MTELFVRWITPVGLMLSLAGVVEAQRPGGAMVDTLRPYSLDSVVVTVERSRTPLVNSTAAIGVIQGRELRRHPLPGLAGALHLVPGVALLDFDGSGQDPEVTIRGFYGGGEAEYVGVLLDGVPVNGLEAGLANWEVVPAAAVERIEVIRGGASSLYGDEAVGGVINVITSPAGEAVSRWELSAGEGGYLKGSAAAGASVAGRAASVFAGVRRVEGFRQHAGRTSGSVGGSLSLRGERSHPGSLTLTTLQHWRAYEDPGPVPSTVLSESRRGSLPVFRFDGAEERLHRLSLDGLEVIGGRTRLSGSLLAEHRSSGAVRTIPLSPDFADTKERDLRATRLVGSAQVEMVREVGSRDAALLAGVEGSAGWLGSEYFSVLQGDPETYRGSAGGDRDLRASGRGIRESAAAFARVELRPLSVVRLTLGGRLDAVRDRFSVREPDEPERLEASHLVFSPRIGLNLRYLDTRRQTGHLFAAAGQSFKAPTMDQRFDQRTVPVPFPPYSASFSNALLEPQFGTSVEVGLYHRLELVPGRLGGDIQLAAYELRMHDEIDFDLESLRYLNIGRSRHRGVEMGLSLTGPGSSSAFVNYTLQAVMAGSGPFRGNRVKAVPRHFVSAGIAAGMPDAWSGALTVTAAEGMVLDDQNTLELPGFARVDGRVGRSVLGVRLFAEVFNLLDRTYNVTGFPDPAGTDLIYYYPAASRTLRLGLRKAP